MSTDHRTEAFDTMASREADLAALFARIDEGDEAAREELDEYGLSLEWSRGRVRYVMSTGGPHDELSWEQGANGAVVDLRYVFMPWFGREEITSVPAALSRLADEIAELVDGMGGVEHLSGFDEADPHNRGTLTCDECGEELDEDGDPRCDCAVGEEDCPACGSSSTWVGTMADGADDVLCCDDCLTVHRHWKGNPAPEVWECPTCGVSDWRDDGATRRCVCGHTEPIGG